MYAALKRLLVGRPLASAEEEHQRLPKTIALAVFSSDAISSTAYATEEILFVLVAAGRQPGRRLGKLVPISIVVAVLLAIVVASLPPDDLRLPQRRRLLRRSAGRTSGETPSLVAGASLLVDYILTVAVSISAGVAAIVSRPFRDLRRAPGGARPRPHRPRHRGQPAGPQGVGPGLRLPHLHLHRQPRRC